LRKPTIFRNRFSPIFYLFLAALSGCEVKIQEETSRAIQPESLRVTNDLWSKHGPAWSPDGSLIAFSSDRIITAFTELNLSGARHDRGIMHDVIEGMPAISPDGLKLAYRSALRGHIWIYDFQSGKERLLTPDHKNAYEPDWSFDGEWIAYHANTESGFKIWMIRPDGTEGRQITQGRGTELTPALSPDGAYVAYSSQSFSGDNDLWVASVSSGSLRRVTSGRDVERNPAWSPDGSTIAFDSQSPDGNIRIWTIPADSGEAHLLDTKDNQSNSHPHWSADGALIAYQTSGWIGIIPAQGGEPVRLTGALAKYPIWLPPANGLLGARTFGYTSIYIASLADTSIRAPLIEVLGIGGLGGLYDRDPAWLDLNNLLYTGRGAGIYRTTILHANSQRLTQGLPRVFFYQRAALSPDGQSVACDNSVDLFLFPVQGGVPKNLTESISDALSHPAWSPDGKQLACHSPYDLRILQLEDGVVEGQVIIPGPYRNPSWSAVHPIFGSHIAVERDNNIYILSPEEKDPQLVIAGGKDPCWSPDGTRMAYIHGNEVYISTIFVPL